MAAGVAPRVRDEHWRRDKPQFYNFLALERSALADGPDPLGGLTGALMSRDERSGSATYVVELPPGFTQVYDGDVASLELFDLHGDLSLEGGQVGSAGYVQLAQGCGGGELRSHNGALALAFWNPNLPAFPPPYTQNRVTKTRDLPWENWLREAHGLWHKSLRLPDPLADSHDGGPGGYLRLASTWALRKGAYEHVHHEAFEEIFVLSGDSLFAGAGVLGVGSVLGHPQGFWHGPFASRGGVVMLVHTDAPTGWPLTLRDCPLEEELCAAYLDETAWDMPAVHTPWEETPFARFHQEPEFREWRAAFSKFDDLVGLDVASKFRASWKRDRDSRPD